MWVFYQHEIISYQLVHQRLHFVHVCVCVCVEGHLPVVSNSCDRSFLSGGSVVRRLLGLSLTVACMPLIGLRFSFLRLLSN
uniref:Uncharacterized protein n=1 Tax=Anguilla anguilla TaxID=7936 RepID=A0A0E9TS16_ANGAN